MTKHCRVYMKYFGYGIDDVIPCEVCGRPGNDIHHIHGRGKDKDVIENLICLCRDHHNSAHGLNHTYLHPDVVQAIHNQNLKK